MRSDHVRRLHGGGVEVLDNPSNEAITTTDCTKTESRLHRNTSELSASRSLAWSELSTAS